jgi:MFS family permease
VFTLASLACGIASSQAMLVTPRAIQGLGGTVVSAVALGRRAAAAGVAQAEAASPRQVHLGGFSRDGLSTRRSRSVLRRTISCPRS